MGGPFPYLLRRIPPFPGASVTVSWGNHQKQCWAFIDTGADSTFIPVWLIGALNLQRLNDEVDVTSPDILGVEIQGLYAANLAFLGLTFVDIPVIPTPRWDEILIGRDLINEWILTLNGPNRTFSIEIT